MLPPFDYFEHLSACQRKQAERQSRIASLPSAYHSPINSSDRSILDKPISALVQDVHASAIKPIDILRTYGKAALRAQEKTNCLTEILLPEAEEWAQGKGVDLNGPLAGIPVSVKDTVAVAGYDSSVGYSRNTGRPCAEDGAMVKILKAAGAMPYTKTNVPITLLSYESSNDVWGRTLNPHNPDYSPGGSTGGESALLAFGGGRIGIGTDVAGSVRVPAHNSGIYSLRCSIGRWPSKGLSTSMAGQEGVRSVCSPMARTLEDLVYFTKSILGIKAWKWDFTVHPLDWREREYQEVKEKKRFKVGVMRTDGVVDPSPTCARALEDSVTALRKAGHECLDVSPPSPLLALQIASHLLNSDGCRTYSSLLRTGETNDPGASRMALYANLPRPLKYLYYLWVRYVLRDSPWASLLDGFGEKSSSEQWRLVARREEYKESWHQWWNESEVDFLLTPVNATPALPHKAMHDAFASCGYTFLFNFIDYSCGVIPVTKVDRTADALPRDFSLRRLNGVAKGAYKYYDSEKMHGLPVGVQIVGRRLEEERVLGIMERVQGALQSNGQSYRLLDIE